MCEGFGGIVTQAGRVLFCEPDSDGNCSHSELLKRLGMKDNSDRFVRHFVRFEFPTWEVTSFRWDEDDSLPGWVTDDNKAACIALLLRVAPAWKVYEETRDAAWKVYGETCDAARKVYGETCDAALKVYIKNISGITGYVPDKQ